MAVGLYDFLFVLTALSGGSLVWLGHFTWQTWDEPGLRAFVALTAVLGFAGVLAGLSGLVQLHLFSIESPRLWSLILGGTVFLSGVIWLVFTLEYTGRWTAPSPMWVLVLSLPAFLGIVTSALLLYGNIPSAQAATSVSPVAAFVTLGYVLSYLYVVAATTIGVFLLVQTTTLYGHLSLSQGLLLSAGILVMLVAGVFGQMFTTLIGYVGYLGSFAVGLAMATILFAFAVHRYDIFESTPAVGSIGEEAVARETDDLIIVTDHRGRIIEVNGSVEDTVDSNVSDHLGEPLPDVLGLDVDTLQSEETVNCHTDSGSREFDAQVAELTDHHDRWVGYLISLRDVTQRQIRQQQLAVLNRVLRHNLRNKLTVVKGSAKAAAEAGEESINLTRIVDAADDLVRLSERAKTIDQYMQDGQQLETSVEITDVLRRVVDDASESHPGVDFEVDLPDAATIETSEAVFERVVANAVENAAVHNDLTDPWVAVSLSVRTESENPLCIEIRDNGPGIPDHELEVIENGTETALEHGSSLGLWVLTWGVRFLGGDLEFEERSPNGTAVRLLFPQQPTVEPAVERANPISERQ